MKVGLFEIKIKAGYYSLIFLDNFIDLKLTRDGKIWLEIRFLSFYFQIKDYSNYGLDILTRIVLSIGSYQIDICTCYYWLLLTFPLKRSNYIVIELTIEGEDKGLEIRLVNLFQKPKQLVKL